MELNKFQTPINEETTKILTEESKQELQDLIVNVPFIKNLVSANREYARDRPRDDKGRIIVDIVKPHILEDMDYFTKAADHFRKHGCYTFLRKNGNKNSEYYKWAKEEIRRVLEGYVRESDGEWVTGDLYFFLNYAPMMVNELLEEGNEGLAVRVEDFPRTWEGIYLRFHYIEQARVGGLYNEFKGGNHAVELAKRGCGKSFSLASLMVKRLILGERIGVDKRVTTILAAYLKEYLSDKDGTLSKFVPMLDFCRENTPFPNSLLKNAAREMSWQMGYIDRETDIKKGSLNTVMGVSVKDQVGKLRGKRGYILVEEMGSFPDLLQVYNNIRPGVESGKLVFGLIYCVGTAGDKESDFHAAQELMCYPTGYNVYALPNVYDKVGQGRANFCYFFPAYLNREGCIRENGVSDVIKALIELLHMRDLARYNTSDPSTIIKVMAENPITPQEAILKVRNKIFPTTDLDARILEIDNNPSFFNSMYTGELYFDDFGEVQFRPTSALPIRQFPHSDNKMEGSIEMSDLPVKNAERKVPADRYLIGLDTYDDDCAETVSLGSVFVMDLWTDKLVAEYTGRPTYADDFYEIVRKLSLFYNAKIMYEQNKKGLFSYMSKMNYVHYLLDTPEYLKEQHIIKDIGYGNKKKGITATAPVNAFARERIAAWLSIPEISITKNEEGEEIEVTRPKLYSIWNRALLQELATWNPEYNFDRVSALGMLILARESIVILTGGKGMMSRASQPKILEDPFFKIYDQKIKNRKP